MNELRRLANVYTKRCCMRHAQTTTVLESRWQAMAIEFNRAQAPNRKMYSLDWISLSLSLPPSLSGLLREAMRLLTLRQFYIDFGVVISCQNAYTYRPLPLSFTHHKFHSHPISNGYFPIHDDNNGIAFISARIVRSHSSSIRVKWIKWSYVVLELGGRCAIAMMPLLLSSSSHEIFSEWKTKTNVACDRRREIERQRHGHWPHQWVKRALKWKENH